MSHHSLGIQRLFFPAAKVAPVTGGGPSINHRHMVVRSG